MFQRIDEQKDFARLKDDDWGRLITETEYEKILMEEINMEEEKRAGEDKEIQDAAKKWKAENPGKKTWYEEHVEMEGDTALWD